MARPQSRFVCQACGASTLRWEGQCRACGEWNTLVETLVRDGARRPSAARPAAGAEPRPLAGEAEPEPGRGSTGIGELDRVLGGGLVAGSVVLLGGEPGIGKSTLVMEAAAGVAQRGQAGVLYASGEESVGQLRLRARRLGVLEGEAGRRILALAETDVERVVERAVSLMPDLVVVDSIQTMRVDGLEGPAGSVGQVREAAARLADHAKSAGVPLILVGHVTKDGSLAGPRTLEHLVDAVLTLEGDRSGSLRLLRAAKNRFGSTEEIGVFEMAGAGLRQVPDPARAFLGDHREAAPGVSVAATLEGSRPLLVEVQVLVAPAAYGTPRRTASGVDANRLALLTAVLGRRAGIGVGAQDLYVSLAGGIAVAEPGLDLAVALAVASAVRDRPVAADLVACGEIGLLGEVRPVAGLERRLREAARLGFRRAVVPGGQVGDVGGIELLQVADLRAAVEAALAPSRRGVPVGGASAG
ncbi:MAG TPA: DNA repair protein RadA [Candidatus Limnocylindrales bacterium]|nr:DNA repair protein RadA [Candidatus Limnocylindrales bacterium]